ncbi:hypothetical protein Q2T42_26020 [Leptolyngbya boryana CZ1]|uniref:Uncharacterized protein n=1 Tax=Leptolyngbya boryana CZ1 TaxID=3060204 RepID=A0AA97APZ9_LEPBY|nr:hypothetical protein [Leptolyngbya boryana]WNZ45249.1 hypothetical protein Q2T42_26020 [Leptolyngbya boryana CZ1]
MENGAGEIEHRLSSPYTSRRTSATISVYEYGENPAIVARRLGHDPRTLFRNYLDDGEGYITPPPDLLAD